MFHTHMELVNQLRLAQQYDQALTVLQYIFDPLAQGTDPNRFWKFKPFQSIVATDSLEEFFQSLKPGVENAAITEWRHNPFSPFVVARSRPVSIIKWVVMTYIVILIDYGDYYFCQNTLESIHRAIQLYVIDSHILVTKPHHIPYNE